MQHDDADLEPSAAQLRPTLEELPALSCDLDEPAPIRGQVGATLREMVRRRPQDRAVVVAVNLETNAVHTCRAFAASGALEAAQTALLPMDEAGDDDDPGPGVCRVGFVVDAWEDLALPRWPGTYHVYVWVGARLSAPVRLSVGFSDRMSSAAVTWYIGDQQRKIHALPVWPPARAPLPTYGPEVELEAPLDVGIDVHAEPVVVLGTDRRAVIRGAFRVPLQPQDRVRPQAGASLAIMRTVIGPKGVVPINLMVLADDRPSVATVPLAVPTDTLEDRSPRTLALGRFAIDLFALCPLSRSPQRLHLLALSSDVHGEVVTITVLDATNVPRRDPPPRS
jgi:hypothetical protein